MALPGGCVTPDEALELRALVMQAFDLKGTPYLVDGCQAIVDWHERRGIRAYESRKWASDARIAKAYKALRATSYLFAPNPKDERERAA
jgi:hypothetical protein